MTPANRRSHLAVAETSRAARRMQEEQEEGAPSTGVGSSAVALFAWMPTHHVVSSVVATAVAIALRVVRYSTAFNVP